MAKYARHSAHDPLFKKGEWMVPRRIVRGGRKHGETH